MRPARAILLFCLAVTGLVSSGCGKKGPPLAPIVRVPGRAMDLKARRTGSTVTLTFTIPSANIDETRPADIAKVEVYAYTAMAQNDVRDTRRMKLIKTIPVRKPPEPEAEGKRRRSGKPGKPAESARSAKPAPPGPGEAQGTVVTVTETLDASMLTPLAPDGKKTTPGAKRAAGAAPVLRGPFETPPAAPLAGPAPAAEAHRYYLVYGVSRSGNRGGASPRPPVPLTAAPAAPPQPDLKATEAGVVVNWSVPPGTRLPFQEPAAEGTLAATYSGGLESAPALSYVVYRVPGAHASTAQEPVAAAAEQRPTLLTDTPIKALTWTDKNAGFGVERCYDVRAVVVQGAASLESDPTPVVCIMPTDTFPPPAPTALAAVAGEGAISLIWVGVEAPDLAGYLVLRAEGPDGTLTPVFETPVRETTYRDATAKPGVRYVYAVIAVDRATPANRSPLSNKVEETAR